MRSPDGLNAIILTLDEGGELSYRAERRGRVVIGDSPLGLLCGEQEFAGDLKLVAVSRPETRRETYTLFAGVRPEVDQLHRRRSVVVRNAAETELAVDLDAGNEGVAFRYRLTGERDSRWVIEEELTGFAVPDGSEGWLSPYSRASTVSPAYEEFYSAVNPGDPPAEARQGPPRGWAFPALFRVPEARAWALLLESGTDGNYCGCHLGADSTDGTYRIEFACPDEGTRGVTHTGGPEPRHEPPWTMPWRAIVLGDSAAEIMTSTLVTDLAPPTEIADTSWMRSGRSSWSWWAYPDGPQRLERYARFVDLAGAFGWEHCLLDAGWWDLDTRPVAARAESEGVDVVMWTAAHDCYDEQQREAKLDELAGAGARGVKVDFWCSDRQDTMAAIVGTLRAAAERKMTLNLHGCTVPRGWQRTYPNLLTAEAVLGAESYLYEPKFPEREAEYHTILPFARNVAGPVDYTPLGLTLRRYERTTTAAHELALALTLTSGLIHYADTPEVYQSLPEAAQAVLRDAPARWDETRCLIGEPGHCVVVARRAGASWFVAGMNGTDEERRVRLRMKPFRRFRERTLVAEGTDPLMELGASQVSGGPMFEHTMPPRGGFVLRLDGE